MIRVQDLGVVGYGSIMAGAEWWDKNRIEAQTLTEKALVKQAAFWAFLGIGIPATVISALGVAKGLNPWLEPVSHGFMYDFPRFTVDLIKAIRAPATTSSDAVRAAQEILHQRQQMGLLNAGQPAHQPTFNMTRSSLEI